MKTINSILFLFVFLLSYVANAQSQDYVDLGLPSGTLWATTNLSGKYAWASTSASTDKGTSAPYMTLRVNKGDYSVADITEYNSTDGKTILETSDDAAYKVRGSSWRVPSVDQWQELILFTEKNNIGESFDYDIDARTLEFELIGLNGNKIELNWDGWYCDGEYYDGVASYWCNEVCSSNYSCAYKMFASYSVPWRISAGERYNDSDIRPVYATKASISVPVTDVTISGPTQASVGETVQLSATVIPSNASRPQVRWSSSDTSVATVDAKTGKVTIMGSGTVKIIAWSGVKKEHTITCTYSSIPVSSISISGEDRVEVGKSITLTATCYPTNATNRSVKWSCSPTTIASINATTGELTGIDEGEVTVTATAQDGSGKKATKSVTVLEQGAVILGTGRYSDNTTDYSRAPAPYCNSYRYSTCQILYGANEIGKDGVINALSFNVSNSSWLTTKVSIYLGYTSANSISVSTAVNSGLTLVYSGEITLGRASGWEKITLNTPFAYKRVNGNLIVVVCHQSTTTNESLKYYSTLGNAIYKRSNSYQHYADYTNTSASYTSCAYRPNLRLSMSDYVPVTSVSITGASSVEEKKTIQLSASCTPSNASIKDVSWSCSPSNRATISSTGELTGLSAGEVTVTATAKDGSGSKATKTITVLESGAVMIGEGTTSSNVAPYCNYYRYSTSQIVYSKTEIGKDGVIEAVSFNVATNVSYPTTDVSVYMGYKSTASFSSSSDAATSGLTCVYSGATTLGSATGWEKITLSTPFVYKRDKGSLLVVVSHKAEDYEEDLEYYNTKTSSNTVLFRQDDDTAGYADYTSSSYSYETSYSRPNIQLLMTDIVSVSTITLSAPSNMAYSSDNSLSLDNLKRTISATVSPSDASEKMLTWSTSNISIAEVSQSGVVTPKGTGTVTITATANDGSNVSKSANIKIYPLGDSNGSMSVNVADVVTMSAKRLNASVATFVDAPADANCSGSFTDSDISAGVTIAFNALQSRPRYAPVETTERIPTTLEILPITMTAGERTELSICINNPTDVFSLFGLTIRVPEGIHFVTDSEGYATLNLGLERTSPEKTDYLNGLLQEDGTMRVLCYSIENALFEGTSGTVATIMIEADHDLQEGIYDIQFEDIELSAYGDEIHVADYSAKINVQNHIEALEMIEAAASHMLIYDLNGRLCGNTDELNHLPKGIYMVNGQKYIK